MRLCYSTSPSRTGSGSLSSRPECRMIPASDLVSHNVALPFAIDPQGKLSNMEILPSIFTTAATTAAPIAMLPRQEEAPR